MLQFQPLRSTPGCPNDPELFPCALGTVPVGTAGLHHGVTQLVLQSPTAIHKFPTRSSRKLGTSRRTAAHAISPLVPTFAASIHAREALACATGQAHGPRSIH